MEFLTYLHDLNAEGKIPPVVAKELHRFYGSYVAAAKANGHSVEELQPLLKVFLKGIIDQIKHPFHFEPYHTRLTNPIDYYKFGIDFIRPLVMRQESKVFNLPALKQIAEKIKQGENVILLANHQTELDPQIISLLIEDQFPQLAQEMIFVAGHRVVSDPMAIPFSKGRNLLCIYSKKYIEDDPSKKEERMQHNQHTMKRMTQLLSEGGKCIYVAPSGGRDRADANGKIEVAPFDPQSIEMFLLMAKQAERPTHFHPLSMNTYRLLPPPPSIKKELGEPRHMHATPVFLFFGDEIDMDKISDEHLDKRQRRKMRAQHIWELVRSNYNKISMKLLAGGANE